MSSSRPPLVTPMSQGESGTENGTPTSRSGVVIDPVSGREVIVEDLGAPASTREELREENSPHESRISSRAQSEMEFERSNGELNQESFAEEFRRLHGNVNSQNVMRSTGINDDNEFNVQNVLRDAIINPANLEQRVNNLRIRSQALAQAADRTFSELANMDLAPRARVPSRQPTPPPNYDQAVRQPVVPQPVARSGAEFTPIRLPPNKACTHRLIVVNGRNEDILERQREAARVQAERIAALEAELEQTRNQSTRPTQSGARTQ
jgi:hypothetical protein